MTSKTMIALRFGLQAAVFSSGFDIRLISGFSRVVKDVPPVYLCKWLVISILCLLRL